MAIGGHTETIEVVMVAGPTNDIVRVVKYKVSMAEGNQKSHSQFCESAKLLFTQWTIAEAEVRRPTASQAGPMFKQHC